MGRDAETSLAPGFRFHPTDEELVRYYLKRRVSNKPFRFNPISVVDIYKSEPWDLPAKSRLKSRDLEWYFFSVLDKKYGNGSRTNRATEKGYWKTTGKDRPIHHGSHTVGMKKTLVYHCGRAPRGERTNWVMHEYRLTDEKLEKSGIAQDAFVLCRIFQKSGTGPKNGEQYGAPFIEEEWEDDELTLVPSEVAMPEKMIVGGDAYVETNDLDQNLDIGTLLGDASPPSNFYHGDTSNYVELPGDFIGEDQKPLIDTSETQRGSELCDDQKDFDFPEKYEIDAKSVRDECVVESSNNVNPMELNYLLDEPYLDATDNPQNVDGLFLETEDLSNPIGADSSGFDMLEEYLTFFDADDDISQYMAFDSSDVGVIEDTVFDQAMLTQKHENGGAEQMPMGSQHLPEAHQNNDAASSSKQIPEATKFESDEKRPFLKQARYMLGSISAPPAFASEFPTKEAVLRLNSVAQPSSSVNLTAGMIRMRSMTINYSGTDWSLGKNGNVNFILSLNLSQDDVSSTSLVPSLFSGKAGSVVTRGWLYFMFFSVLILSMSFKIGTCIYGS